MNSDNYFKIIMIFFENPIIEIHILKNELIYELLKIWTNLLERYGIPNDKIILINNDENKDLLKIYLIKVFFGYIFIFLNDDISHYEIIVCNEIYFLEKMNSFNKELLTIIDNLSLLQKKYNFTLNDVNIINMTLSDYNENEITYEFSIAREIEELLHFMIIIDHDIFIFYIISCFFKIINYASYFILKNVYYFCSIYFKVLFITLLFYLCSEIFIYYLENIYIKYELQFKQNKYFLLFIKIYNKIVLSKNIFKDY